MPCTPPDKVILFVQTVGSVAVMAGSVAVCSCMSMHQEHFKGHCALFSTGEWQERDGQLKVDWASQAYCNFSIFVAVISFLTGAVLTGRFSQMLYFDKEESFLSTFFDTLATSCLLVMLLISSFFVSFGSLKWCRQIVQRFPHCEDAAGNDILKADDIDTNGFYWMLTVSQFGNWLSFLGCVTVFMASMIKAMRYHVAENLRVTMMKARTKLIYSDNDPMIQDVPTSYSARPLSSQYIDRDGNPVPTATRGMIGEDPYMEQQPQQQQQQHRFLPPGSSSLSKRRRRRKRVPTAADQEDIIEEAAAIEEEEDPEGVDNTMQIQSDRHSQAYRRHHNQLQQHHSPEQQQQPAQVQVEEEPKFPSMGNQIRVVTDDEDVGTRERRRSKEEQELNADEGSEDEGEGDEEGEEEEDNEEEEGDEEEDGDEGNSSRSSSRSSSNSSQEDVSSNRSVTSSRDPSGK